MCIRDRHLTALPNITGTLVFNTLSNPIYGIDAAGVYTFVGPAPANCVGFDIDVKNNRSWCSGRAQLLQADNVGLQGLERVDVDNVTNAHLVASVDGQAYVTAPAYGIWRVDLSTGRTEKYLELNNTRGIKALSETELLVAGQAITVVHLSQGAPTVEVVLPALPGGEFAFAAEYVSSEDRVYWSQNGGIYWCQRSGDQQAHLWKKFPDPPAPFNWLSLIHISEPTRPY
eukprot:TRINITY_DN44950_c0_g1_i1.p1 TRINITY_DN44950_c0_g1~~TRINITY_DN44950_c0_g1_i1.p1  ORF type:complete len:229 (+),score=62.16 TRINITY_DN44950_c0_g1_i1:150-836(+)